MTAVAKQKAGVLKLVLIEGSIAKETNAQLDLYVAVETPHQKGKTKTLAGRSKQKPPKWNQIFDITVHYIGDEIKLFLFDEDVDSDHLLGSAAIELSTLCIHSGIDSWIVLEREGEQTSAIHLKATWVPTIPASPEKPEQLAKMSQSVVK